MLNKAKELERRKIVYESVMAHGQSTVDVPCEGIVTNEGSNDLDRYQGLCEMMSQFDAANEILNYETGDDTRFKKR
jgi:hypothetical protein